MDIRILKNSIEIGSAVSGFLAEEIRRKPNLLLCTASGNTPTMVYAGLVEKMKTYPTDFMRIIKLDEWGRVSMHDPMSCEYYLQKHLIKPLNISQYNYFGFDSNHDDPELEIQRMKNVLHEQGPIDVCILGLGLNGHVAFNEPPCAEDSVCHIAKLSTSSLSHPMSLKMGVVPEYGLTLGMKDILQSKKIIMLISGEKKRKIAKEFLSGQVTPNLPASFLWKHNDVHCFIDELANSN